MLDFFPKPHPDELLYSVLARYHIRSGNIFPRDTMKDLFGNSNILAVADLPCNIDALTHNYPYRRKLKSSDLIFGHTLFPYYTAFLSAPRTRAASLVMRNPHGRNIYIRTGITASSFHISSFLKYCTECCRGDISQYGEYYWHRIHNTPGVSICPAHKEILIESSVDLRENHHEFIDANSDNCRQNSGKNFSNPRLIEELTELAGDIEWLYDNYKEIKKSQDAENGFRLKYLSLLAGKGLTERRFRRHFLEGFFEDFHRYYSSDFLRLMQSDYSINDPRSWPVKILRKQDKSFHPLRHLLVIRYLSGSPEHFFGLKKLDLNGMVPVPKHYCSHANIRIRTYSAKVIDWKTRDRETLVKAKALVRRILEDDKLSKITVNIIGKHTGALAWIKKHPAEMPMTISYLHKAIETTEEYRIRRIERIASRLHSEGFEIRIWEIKRLAGIRPGYSAKVAEALTSVAEKYSSFPDILMKTG